jgi:hypothetical protein
MEELAIVWSVRRDRSQRLLEQQVVTLALRASTVSLLRRARLAMPENILKVPQAAAFHALPQVHTHSAERRTVVRLPPGANQK